MSSLLARHCQALAPGTPPLDDAERSRLLAEVPRWQIAGKALVRTFQFPNFHETMAFVNALAWVAHREDHHPDLEVSYARCKVSYWTHTVGGLSENDFICAAKISALLSPPT